MSLGLMRDGGYLRWLTGAQLARLPDAMAPLAFTTMTAAMSGSAAAGGAMIAAMVTAEIGCSVPAGRVLDRIGITRGTRSMLLARALAYLGLLSASIADLPIAVLVALAALPGVLGAGVIGAFRAMLPDVVPTASLPRAVALNAIATDLVIIIGPLLAAGLANQWIAAPLAAIAATSATAAGLTPRAPRPHPERDSGPHGHARLIRPLLRWAITAFALGHVCASVEVAALPLAQRLNAGPTGAALLIAAFCATSMAASLAYTTLFTTRTSSSAIKTAMVLLIAMAAGRATLAISDHWAWSLTGAAIAGACVGPLLTLSSVHAEHHMPAHRHTEGFAILTTAQSLGFAAGSITLTQLPLPTLGIAATATTLLATAALLTTRTQTAAKTHQHSRPD